MKRGKGLDVTEAPGFQMLTWAVFGCAIVLLQRRPEYRAWRSLLRQAHARNHHRLGRVAVGTTAKQQTVPTLPSQFLDSETTNCTHGSRSVPHVRVKHQATHVSPHLTCSPPFTVLKRKRSVTHPSADLSHTQLIANHHHPTPPHNTHHHRSA